MVYMITVLVYIVSHIVEYFLFGNHVDNYAGGCKYVFAFEARALVGLEICLIGIITFVCYAFLQMGAGTTECSTGAKFALQAIGQIEYS